MQLQNLYETLTKDPRIFFSTNRNVIFTITRHTSFITNSKKVGILCWGWSKMVENEARATTIVASKLEGSNLVNENSMADHLMPESCLMSIEQKLCKVKIF